MTNKITLEQALELVHFRKDDDGNWSVGIVNGDCDMVIGHCGTVKGNCFAVEGDVCKADAPQNVGWSAAVVNREIDVCERHAVASQNFARSEKPFDTLTALPIGTVGD